MTHGTPKGLALALSGHTIHTAQSKGWDTLSNGALLDAAKHAGFQLLLTTDRRIRHQQNLAGRRIALVVLTGSTKWSLVRLHADRIAAAVAPLQPAPTLKSRFPSIRNRALPDLPPLIPQTSASTRRRGISSAESCPRRNGRSATRRAPPAR